MQIVINIDEEDYKVICDEAHHSVGYDTPVDNAMVAIANGKPLSKGHGRLIDAKILIKDMKNGINAGLLIDGYEKYTNINSVDDCVFCVECADTVLEADKEV